jgi:hypothetical protein
MSPPRDAAMPQQTMCVGRIPPVGAHDESSDTRHACKSLESLEEDGVATGLDYAEGVPLTTIAGDTMAGCVRLDFDRVYRPENVYLRVRPVGSACDDGTPCSGEFCGTGRTVVVYFGTERDQYQRLISFDLMNHVEFATWTIGPVRRDLKHLVICRSASGPARDDIEVDSVHICER